LTVQKSPSSHAAPGLLGKGSHPAGPHTPTVHGLSRKEQSIGWPAVHTPPLQAELAVQGSASSHGAPSLTGATSH
jgi:hypothetical protein